MREEQLPKLLRLKKLKNLSQMKSGESLKVSYKRLFQSSFSLTLAS